MAPERRTNRPDTRAASTLLLPKLAACAADFALVFGLMRARAQSAQIPPRSFMQQVGIHLRAKYRVGELHLPDLLAIQIDDIHDRHSVPSRLLRLLGGFRTANKYVRAARARHGAAHQ